jgi:hypothetical protein
MWRMPSMAKLLLFAMAYDGCPRQAGRTAPRLPSQTWRGASSAMSISAMEMATIDVEDCPFRPPPTAEIVMHRERQEFEQVGAR